VLSKCCALPRAALLLVQSSAIAVCRFLPPAAVRTSTVASPPSLLPPIPPFLPTCRSRTGALELTALSLKATGSYLSRTLAYAGAEFLMCHVDVAAPFKWVWDGW
jgi:hypothetical protein